MNRKWEGKQYLSSRKPTIAKGKQINGRKSNELEKKYICETSDAMNRVKIKTIPPPRGVGRE